MPSAVKRAASARVFERCGRTGRPRCQYCGAAVARKPSKWCDTVFEFTLDHVLPVSLGGRYLDENLLAACRPCNHARATTPLDQFIEQLGSRAVMTVDEARRHMELARVAHDRQLLLDTGFRHR